MFQQIALLCMSAVLNAAHAYEYSPADYEYSSAWGGNKNDIGSTSTQYFSAVNTHDTHAETRDGQIHDTARSYANFELAQNHGNAKKFILYPKDLLDVDKQEKTDNSRRNMRNKVTKYIGRGLFKNLIDSVKQKGLLRGLKDAVKNTVYGAVGFVNETAKITTDFVHGSVKLAADVVSDSAKLTKDVVGGSLNISKNAIGWVANSAIEVGKRIVKLPMKKIELTINAAWAVHTFGVGLTAQIISDTADWFQGNWEAVKAVEFPGKHVIVMLYPSGLMSVLNRLTREIMYMLDEGHRMLTHAFAYTLYVSLKIVFDYLSKVIVLGNLDCIKLRPQKIKVDRMLVGTIHTKKGKVCGISHIKPQNNVSIRTNDEKFLIVSTPWILEDLSVHLSGVEVTGGHETLLDNEAMDTTIKKIKATGTVSFEAGTLLRFVRLHIEVDDMEGLTVKFPTKNKSRIMEYIETLSDYFTGLVKKELNHVLGIIENKVFEYIANI